MLQSLKNICNACILVLAFPLFAQAQSADSDAHPPSSAELDWVPNESLPAEQIPAHCNGLYIAPISDSPEANDEPETSPVRGLADSTQLDGESAAYFSGDVRIEEGYRRLSSDDAAFNRETKIITLEGNVVVREPGLLIRADRAVVDQENGSGLLEPADYLLHKEHVRGTADRLRRKEDETLVLEQASYTLCEPNNNSWQLRASRIAIDQDEGVGTARHARVNIKGVPVFYSPYLQFPIDDRRRSGFLWPSYSNTSIGGFDVSIPYYFNLAPNYDATITPRYISSRGWITETEARYLNSKSSWVVGGTYLNDDESSGDDRWLAAVRESGRLTNNWSTLIEFTRVSDDEFFNDLSTVGLDVKRETHLDQLALAQFNNADWRVFGKLQQFQTIEPTILPANRPYKLLPQLNGARTQTNAPFELQYLLNGQYTYFDHEERTRGHRIYAETGISYPMEWLAGFVKPTAKIKHASYSLDKVTTFGADEVPDANKEPDYTIPLFNIDSGLYFERELALDENPFIQTLEPRLYYLYVNDQNQADVPLFDTTPLTFNYSQLFREDRFTGHDRVGDANQLTLGVTTRFIDDDTGAERLSASVGQIFYFDDRTVIVDNDPDPGTASTSQIAGEMVFKPDRDLRLASSVLWDSRQDKINEGGVDIQYLPGSKMLFNIGYRYRRDSPVVLPDGQVTRDTIEQSDFSAVFPISKRWQGYMRWQYDLRNHNTIEDLAGLQYSDCCWDLRLVYQRALDSTNEREHAVYLQFVLRGLGRLGDKIDRILDRSIVG
ncbi:MAG: LPS-assembly protein LptD, partial [Pseudomonadales bacterium]